MSAILDLDYRVHDSQCATDCGFCRALWHKMRSDRFTGGLYTDEVLYVTKSMS